MPFFNHQLLVGGLPSNGVNLAGRPVHYDGVDPRRRSQPEMQPRIARRLEAAVGANFLGLDQISGFQFDSSPESIPVRPGADGFDAQPVSGCGLDVSQQRRRTVENGHGQVQVPVVQKISHSCSPTHPRLGQRRTRLKADLLEPSVPQVAEQEWAFRVGDAESVTVDLGIDVAVGYEQIFQPSLS